MIMIVCLSCNCKTQTATDAYKQRLNIHRQSVRVYLCGVCCRAGLCAWISREDWLGICVMVLVRLLLLLLSLIIAQCRVVVVSRMNIQALTHTQTACTHCSKSAFWFIWQQLNLRLTRALFLFLCLSPFLSLCLSLAHFLCSLIMHT